MKMQTTGRILLHGLFRRWDLFVYLNLAILGTILMGSLAVASQLSGLEQRRHSRAHLYRSFDAGQKRRTLYLDHESQRGDQLGD